MSRWMAIAAALVAIATATAATAADTKQKLVLQLRGPAQFEFAGYYAALWQGFYRDAGLNLDIKPGAIEGQPPIDPVREVTEGRAAFGIGGGELVIRAGQGLPLLLLAPIFQRSGAGVYYRSDEDFASPGALAGAKVGMLPASDMWQIEMTTALKAEGVELDKLRPVPVQPGQAVAALADRRVDAVAGSAWTLPWLAHEKGFEVKSFNPADYRVEFYGDTLFTTRRLAEAEPALVRGFRDASLKGWEYALQHSDEIAKRITDELPPPPGISDVAGYEQYAAELAHALSRYPAVALGHSNPDRWNRIEASLVGVGALLRTADAESFIYDPDAKARDRNDLKSLAIIGGTLAAVAIIAALLLRRRRPLATRSTAPASASTVAPPSAAAAPDTPRAAAAATKPEPAAAPAVAPAAAATPAASAGVAAPPVSIPAKPSEAAPADLNTEIAGLERTIRQRLPRAATFRLSLLPSLWRCRAEPRTVRRLVLDLAAAAAAEIREGGELIVGTRNFAFTGANLAATPGAQLGEYVRVTVRDSGPGLSEEALDKVLDPAASSRPSAAAAATALRSSGGFVRVESAEGIGTAVHLYFPRVEEAATTAKPQAAAAE